jgi:formylglycine-generating enzyme required for sulfatase activity
MRTAILVLLVAGLGLNGNCLKAQDASRRALAEELLNEMDMKGNLEKSFAMVKRVIPSQMARMKQAMEKAKNRAAGTPETAAAMQDKMTKATTRMMDGLARDMSWAKVKDDYIALYAETFTEEELRGLVAFYKSPAGRAFAKKQPELVRRSMELTQKRMLQWMPRFQAMTADMIAAAHKDAKRAVPPAAARANVFDMPSGQTSMQFVAVGDPGNAADTSGYGSVGYVYEMGKYDVTLSQYAAFLNAVAKTDAYGLYTIPGMATDYPEHFSASMGIIRSGSDGSYSYSVMGNGNIPVFDVSWVDAARFCNWLQNGQPAGAQGPGTTETGAYALNGAITSSNLTAIARNEGATYFLPTENEWYKAAYYKGGGTNVGYWLYPTKSNTAPSNTLSATGANNANYRNGNYAAWTLNITPAGYFAGSPGPYGTYDMGGDVWQWTETAVSGSSRILRGGSLVNDSDTLASSRRHRLDPRQMSGGVGFRVASKRSGP